VRFERRIRDVASRAVAHLKRGDGVTIAATSGDRVRADRSVGADRLLRFLALVDAVDTPAATAVTVSAGTPPARGPATPATPAPPSSSPVSGAAPSIATTDVAPPSGPPSGLRSPAAPSVKS
jgi:uncharacterized protein (DUF58 family)